MPPNRTLHNLSASLYLTTFILALTTASTSGVLSPHPAQTIDTLPLVASSLASAFALSLSLITFFAASHPQRWNAAFHLSSLLLSTTFTALMIAVAYLRRSSAVLPCTAGQTPNGPNPYISRCQLRQTLFWTSVLAAVAFACNSVLAGVLLRRAKLDRGCDHESEQAPVHNADADADSITPPPTYREKDVDGEADEKWDEPVREAV